jgi:hypothetical protein
MIPSKQGSNDSIIDKYDLNRDGVIDENEAELLKKDLREGTPQIKKPSKKNNNNLKHRCKYPSFKDSQPSHCKMINF